MKYKVLSKLPVKINVVEVVSSRYASHDRPSSWDARVPGIDTVRTIDGDLIQLRSAGDQSPPKPGWNLMLVSGNPESGYDWTLFGMPAAN